MLGAQEELAAEGHAEEMHRIPETLTRLTKNVAAAMAAGAAAFALGMPSAHAACGERGARAADHERRATIELKNLDRNGPVYYWHDSSTYALLYFRPEDLIARLETLLAKEQGSDRDSAFGDASLGPALLDNIKVDLPLKESTDLFRYTLIDQRFDPVVNVVIADLLKEGKVMLDQWVLVDDPSKTIVMVSRTNASGAEHARWFCTKGDDILFSIEDASFDYSP